MDHVRGAPLHPQTQGKIERWHQTLKNRVLLENYFLPGDLENQIEACRALQPSALPREPRQCDTADAYFGRAEGIIKHRERIKRQTIKHRRLLHAGIAA
jgi:Integrase core domain.